MTRTTKKNFLQWHKVLEIQFTSLMKKCNSKSRQEATGTSLEGEEPSENEQLLEDLIKRFEESDRERKQIL